MQLACLMEACSLVAIILVSFMRRGCSVIVTVSCSRDGVPSALRPGDRTQPPMLGQHQRSGVRLHQRSGSGRGGQLPGK